MECDFCVCFSSFSLITAIRHEHRESNSNIRGRMALRQVIRRGRGTMASTAARSMARGGGGPPQPPFARIKPVDYEVSKSLCIWTAEVCQEL